MQAVKHIHECALACTVLTDHGVNLATPKSDRDIVVGEDASEALDDAQQLDRHVHRGDRGCGCVSGTGRDRTPFRRVRFRLLGVRDATLARQGLRRIGVVDHRDIAANDLGLDVLGKGHGRLGLGSPVGIFPARSEQ